MTTRLIKSADAARLAPILAPLELRDVHVAAEALLVGARREAVDILRKAHDTADAVMTEARLQREKITRDAALLAQEATDDARRRAHDEGHAAGLEAGRREAFEASRAGAQTQFDQQSESARLTIAALADEWQARRDQWLVEARDDVLTLVIAIVRRIAPRLGELNSQIAADGLADILVRLGARAGLVVTIHPDDHKATEAFAAALLSDLHGDRGVVWRTSDTVGRGGVRVECPVCTMDATLLTQAERIADEILADWRSRLPAAEGAPPIESAAKTDE